MATIYTRLKSSFVRVFTLVSLTILFSSAFAASETPNWTGFYGGGHVGGGWSTVDWYEDSTSGGSGLPPGTLDGTVKASGVLGGLQAGYDYQLQQFVLGLQANISSANINGNTAGCPSAVSPTGQACGTKINWLGTGIGHIGFAYNQALFYTLGGFAWSNEELTNYCPNCTNPNGNYTFSGTRLGWIIGAGLEYKLQKNLSALIEYNYIDLGKKNLTFVKVPSSYYTEDISERLHSVKLGLNYRF